MRVVGVLRGEHSGGGMEASARGAPVEDGDTETAVMEFEGEGEADDASAGDADVGIRGRRVLHGISLVGFRREDIVWMYPIRERMWTCRSAVRQTKKVLGECDE